MLKFSIFLFAILFISCQNQTKLSVDENKTQPEIFLKIGSGGGFTGLWTGYEVDTNGTIFSWQGESADSSTKKMFGKLDAEKMMKIKNILSDEKLTATNENSPGNFSYYLKAKSDQPKIWNSRAESAEYLTVIYESVLSVIEDKEKLDQEN